MLSDISPVDMRKKLDKILERSSMPLTVLTKEIGIAFPTLYSFMHNKRKQRYPVLKKIAVFLKKYEKKTCEEKPTLQ